MWKTELRPNMLVALPAPYNRGSLKVELIKLEHSRALKYAPNAQGYYVDMAVDCEATVGAWPDSHPYENSRIEFSGGTADIFLCLGQLETRSVNIGYIGKQWVFLHRDTVVLLPDWLYPSLQPAA